MLENEGLDLIITGRCIPSERLPADGAILCSGRHDHVTVATDLGFEHRLLFHFFDCLQVVDPPHLAVDVRTGQVGIGLEHLGVDRAPHDHLDDALRDALLDHVRDPGVPEEVWGQALLDPGTPAEVPELGDGCLVSQGGPPVVDEDRGVSFRGSGVVHPPLGDVLLPGDDGDIPGDVGLEVHVRDNPVLVEGEVLPFHARCFSNPETPLVDHGNHGPVVAPVAGLVEELDLLRREHLGCGLGHRVGGRDLDAHHLLLGEWDVLVLDEPDQELFQDPHEVVPGVL